MNTNNLLPLLTCLAGLSFFLILGLFAWLVFQNKKDADPKIQALKDELAKQQTTFEEQLKSLKNEMQLTREQVGQNLNSVTSQVETFGEIQKGIGEVREAASRISKLGEDISGLQEILKNPKHRGGFGELLLENLLSQVLPEEMYQLQYSFADGSRVDASVFLGERILPIDAKFPLDKFQEYTISGQASSRRSFITAVKKRIDETTKYIQTTEKTYDFAMMYVPAENVYYSIICEADIFQYALDNHVIPVSPNSFYAYLHVVAFGLRGMQIEQNARLILERLTTLSKDYRGVVSAYSTLGTHVVNAKNKYDEVEKKMERLGDKMDGVSAGLNLPGEEAILLD